MRGENEKKGSDFPSTLVIREKLDFFEIPSKLLGKVLLDIHPFTAGNAVHIGFQWILLPLKMTLLFIIITSEIVPY